MIIKTLILPLSETGELLQIYHPVCDHPADEASAPLLKPGGEKIMRPLLNKEGSLVYGFRKLLRLLHRLNVMGIGDD